jgi:hypothetical protein
LEYWTTKVEKAKNGPEGAGPMTKTEQCREAGQVLCFLITRLQISLYLFTHHHVAEGISALRDQGNAIP